MHSIKHPSFPESGLHERIWKVSDPKVHAELEALQAKLDSEQDRLHTYIKELGGEVGHTFYRYGRIAGIMLPLGVPVPEGWRRPKNVKRRFRSAIVPNRRLKAGREAMAFLEGIKMPNTADLYTILAPLDGSDDPASYSESRKGCRSFSPEPNLIQYVSVFSAERWDGVWWIWQHVHQTEEWTPRGCSYATRVDYWSARIADDESGSAAAGEAA